MITAVMSTTDVHFRLHSHSFVGKGRVSEPRDFRAFCLRPVMARYCNASWITCTWILCLSGLCLIELSSATDRHFFIAAVEVIWDYAPSGQNKVGLDDE